MDTKAKNNRKSLHGRIMSGYLRIIFLSCILGAVVMVFLTILSGYYKNIATIEDERMQLSSTISAHYQWRADLIQSLETGSAFTGSLDAQTCSFGKWVDAHASGDIPAEINTLIQAVTTPHTEMHDLAKQLLAMKVTDKQQAIDTFFSQLAPLTDQVIEKLQNIDSIYISQLENTQKSFNMFLTGIIVIIIIGMIIMAVISFFYAKHLARGIALPIMKVADWANYLSLGAVEFNFDEEFAKMEKDNAENEVGIMIAAFRKMANSIKENVEVLQRVAGGDMTAFVNIRSHHDSLGRSLYRLVQSNDAMFNEIVEAAHSVAAGANEIANASHLLAESTTAQASAAHSLSDEMENVSRLIHINDERAQVAYGITKEIEADLEKNNEHMKVLVDSVVHMHDASQKIAVVMKTIDDIAFETNILALNAAIEAARAGVAGKGFAVVADEVRALALKSTEAAKESRALIENSIAQTQKGSEIATESAVIFEEINQKIDKIVKIVDEVSGLSAEQMESVQQVAESVSRITQAATSNAAISEESDASSQEMSRQADVLRSAMKHFTLRTRQQGQAFIPDEKQGDTDFIKHANEAHKMKESTGHFGYEYIDPFGQKMEEQLLEKGHK